MTKATPLNHLSELDTLYSLIANKRTSLRKNVESKSVLRDELAKLAMASEYLSKITKHRDAVAALLEKLEAEEVEDAEP